MLGVDFDGTLAEIVDDPDEATTHPQLLPLLSGLSHSLLAVAVISGRDTDFLMRRLPLEGLILVGNHGLEERREGRSYLLPEAGPYLQAIRRAADTLAKTPGLRAPGVRIEVKQIGVSVHVRQAQDPAAAAAALLPILQGIADREQLQLQRGRMVLELRPPVTIDKGQVMRRLVAHYHPAAIVYAGDDRTDLDAFRALRSMAAESIRTLAVGIRSHEVPPDIFRDCDVVLNGVAGTIALLRELSALSPAA